MAAAFDPARDGTKDNETGSRHGKIIERARDAARLAEMVWGPAYRNAEDDQAFLAGQQWDPVDAAMRRRAGRLTLVINDLGQFLDQIVGDLRMNPTQIRVRAADMLATQGEFVSVSGRKYSPADVRAGLLREIEYRSMAPIHYALAGQHAAETGLGFLRLYHDYLDPRTFAQDVRVERIKNRWSVWCDPMATEPDWSDQNDCFVGAWMKRDLYRKKYPNSSVASIMQDDRGFWAREGFVRITEYYWREDETVDLYQLDNGVVIRSTETEAVEVAKVSGRIVNARKATVKKVNWALINYSEVLGEVVTEPGEFIPVVPVIGKRLEGKEDDLLYGIVRFAKDPKRMENYWLTSATERVSMLPSAPWIVTPNMIKGFEAEWANANSGLKAYLTYNIDDDAPGAVPTRPNAASIPAGEMQMILAFGEKVKATVGFHDAGVGKARNEQSGVAIEKLQHESDVGAYVFSANLQAAVARIGIVANQWLASIYDTERYITIRQENGEVDVIEINKITETGELVNDLSAGRFDVHVDAGPSYSTLRQQSAETLLELMKIDPSRSIAFADIAVENMDFPGAERVAARLRKMVPPNLLSEDEKTPEERNAPPPPIPPEIQAEIAKSQAAMATASATVDKAEATKVQAKADIASATADMVRTIAGSPEQDETNFNAAKGAQREQDAQKAEAKGEAPAGLDDAIKELILSTIAEAMATQQQGAMPNGRSSGSPAPSRVQ